MKYLPSLIWMSVIFYFSSQTTSAVGSTAFINFIFYKTLHLSEYAILAITLYIAFTGTKYILIIGYLYSITDEIHQSFTPGRSPKFSDTLIDLSGIILGLLFLNIFFGSKLFLKLKRNLNLIRSNFLKKSS